MSARRRRSGIPIMPPVPPPDPPGGSAAPRAARPSERGIALILVLIILPLVAIIMTQLDFEVTIGEQLANNLLATQQFKFAIHARVHQMRLRLVRDLVDDEKMGQQQGAADHASDLWGPDTEGGGTSLVVKRGDEEAGDSITLYTEVTDEQGKFNLNLLRHNDAQRRARAQEVLKNLLDFFRDPRFGDFSDSEWDLDDQEAKEVAEAIVHFLRGEERDERVRASDLPAPTSDTKQGVLTVRDLVFCHRLFLEKRLLERFTDLASNQRMPDLADFLTVHGTTAINPNTAPVQVLRALFREDQGQREVAEAIFTGRGGYLNTPEDLERREEDRKAREEEEAAATTTTTTSSEEETSNAYASVNDLTQKVDSLRDTGFLLRNAIDPGRDFAVRSNFFSVTVTAVRENFVRQQRLILERHARGTITWQSEVRAADLRDLPVAPATDGEGQGG